jgi:nucleoside 2-deoxyribosyltransferase
MKKLKMKRIIKIYFAAPITNKIPNLNLYSKIVKYLSHYGNVLNKRLGDRKFWKERKNKKFSEREIHDFDLKLLLKSDVVVAEISSPSLGVGYEIGRAVERKKPVLALYNKKIKKQVSKMILGAHEITIRPYRTSTEIKSIIRKFFNSLSRVLD